MHSQNPISSIRLTARLLAALVIALVIAGSFILMSLILICVTFFGIDGLGLIMVMPLYLFPYIFFGGLLIAPYFIGLWIIVLLIHSTDRAVGPRLEYDREFLDRQS
ncbi:MAG: hypothetical protein ACKVH8_07965 [Pirellulales bacterium]